MLINNPYELNGVAMDFILKFAIEKKVNKKLSFSDVKITRRIKPPHYHPNSEYCRIYEC